MINNEKKALVVVSFGTSHMDTRKKTIEECEKKLKLKFNDMDFYRAWTSRMIIKKLKKRDGEHIMFPDELLEKLYYEGYTEVYIQSLHLICGEEYNKLLDIVDSYRKKFKSIVVGRPLLTSLTDYEKIYSFINDVSITDCKYDYLKNKKSATVWMGHGTEHSSHCAYAALDYRLRLNEVPAYIGTVEGYPELSEVIKFLKKDNIEKVHLRPLLLVAGDHAKNDMADSEDKESWYSILKQEGFEVEVHLEGLGEFNYIQEKFVDNLNYEVECILKNKKDYTLRLKEKDEDMLLCEDKKINFYGIGVGPGDSDLVTIKAVKIIQSLDILYVPQSKAGGESIAKTIINKYLNDNIIIKERYFPMNYNQKEKEDAWDKIALEIIDDAKSGKIIGFVTLGDPMVYSTYVYLYERVKDILRVKTIPGITSFINIASSNNFPLAMDKESLGIISCTDDYERISDVIDRFDSIVLMKVYKNFKEIIDIICKKGLSNKMIVVSNSSMENEKIYRDIDEIRQLEFVPYFTTIIINKRL